MATSACHRQLARRDESSVQEVKNDLIPVLARRGMLTDETMERMANAALAAR